MKDGVSVKGATTGMRAMGTTLAKEFGHNHGIDVRSSCEVVQRQRLTRSVTRYSAGSKGREANG
jgi:hypothetical protein